MMFKFQRFNIYLLAALCLLVASGCSSPEKKKKKEATEISLHLEVNQDGTTRNEPVPILRGEHPIYVNVDKDPFVDTGHVEEASIVNDMGGFSIQLKLNWQGTQILDGITGGNRGKRIAVFCKFGRDPRWLAAPQITKHLSAGVFTFTPDATREEAERIVTGLNNVAEKVKKDSKWW
jgi:preprotein translocase subunit SecD